MATVLEHALAYGAAGLSVVPIKTDGTKAPAVAWKQFQTRSAPESLLASWFAAGRAGPALVCGKVSGNIEVIDFETAQAFDSWRALIEGEAGNLIDRLSLVRTPGKDGAGGRHVWYRHDGTCLGNTKLALAADGATLVETRGEGGYALVPGCPPACHPSGRTYEHVAGPAIGAALLDAEERQLLWEAARALSHVRATDRPAPPAPGAALSPGDDFDRRGPGWAAILGPHGWRETVRSGERVLWRRPGKDRGWSATTGHCHGKDGVDLLYVFSSNAPPFEFQKSYGPFRAFALLGHQGDLSAAARALARQGYGAGPKPAPRPAASPPVTTAPSPAAAHPFGPAPAAPKAPPVRLPPPYQPFPLTALPLVPRAFVRETADAIGCDPAYIALPALAAIAGAVGGTRVIRLKYGWHEPAVLWCAVVGDSGTLKSPAWLAALRHLFRRQAGLLRAHRAAEVEHRQAIRQHKSSGRTDDPPVAPVAVRHLCSDATMERLAELLAENPRGLLLARDELAGWLGSFLKYKNKGAGSDLPNWLEIHRAGAIAVDRKTGERRTLFVPRAPVSVAGGIQPGVLTRALTPEFMESGLAARLLLAMPPRKPKKWTEAEVDERTEVDWARLLDHLLSLEMDEDRVDGTPRPRVLSLAPDAKALWVDWYDGWAQEQAAAEGELAAAYSKLEGYAARFALVHHVAQYAGVDSPDDRPVGAASVEAGVVLARWFAGEVRRVYSLLTETEEQTGTRRLIEFAGARGGRLTSRDLMRANCRRYPDRDTAERALAALVDAGRARWLEDQPRPQGGGSPIKAIELCMTHDSGDSGAGDVHDDGPAQAGKLPGIQGPAEPLSPLSCVMHEDSDAPTVMHDGQGPLAGDAF